MAVTFPVDDVTPAGDALATRRFADVVGDVLAFGGDGERRVVAHGPAHPLLGAVHLAFAQHRRLVLSPDAVWLTIAQGVAHHVRLHAETLRPRLVRHAGKKVLTVTWAGPMPTDAASWAQIVGRFRDQVGAEVGEGRARLIECDFSTTTDLERVASQIVLMDVYAPYFDFYLAAICGIPEVTLLGTVADWRSIRARVDVIAELDLTWWTRSLAPIADQFVRAASGDADVAFWKRIYNPRDAYGGEQITGWITRLYPYLQDGGRISTRNPMLALPLAEPRGHDEAGPYDGPGVRSDAIPAGPSTASVVVEDSTCARVRHVDLDGGVLAVTQDAAGGLMPICGWLLRDARPSMGAVIERIRTEHQATPAPTRDWRAQLRVSGPAELVALYDQLDGALLFANDAPWRIRALDAQEGIELALPNGRSYSVVRFIDLPDGTYVALADTHPPVYVRGHAAALEPLPPPRAPSGADSYLADDIVAHPRPRTSSELASDVDVIASSLAALLTSALDSHGHLDMPSQGRLIERIPDRLGMSAAARRT